MARFHWINCNKMMPVFWTIYLVITINTMQSRAEDVKDESVTTAHKLCTGNSNTTCNKSHVTDKNDDNQIAMTSSNIADLKDTIHKPTADTGMTSDSKNGKKLSVHPSVIGVTAIVILYIIFLILYYIFYTRKKQKNAAKEEDSSRPLKDRYNDSAVFESSVMEKNSNSSYIWPICEEDSKYMLPRPSTANSLSDNSSTIHRESSYPFMYILNDYDDNIPSGKDYKSGQSRCNGHGYPFNQDNGRKSFPPNPLNNETIQFNISEANDSDLKEDSMLLLPACNITRKPSYRRACRDDNSYSTDGVSSNDNDDVFINDEPCANNTLGNNLTVSKTKCLPEQNSNSNSNSLLQPVPASVTSLLRANDVDDSTSSDCGITLVVGPNDVQDENANHVQITIS